MLIISVTACDPISRSFPHFLLRYSGDIVNDLAALRSPLPSVESGDNCQTSAWLVILISRRWIIEVQLSRLRPTAAAQTETLLRDVVGPLLGNLVGLTAMTLRNGVFVLLFSISTYKITTRHPWLPFTNLENWAAQVLPMISDP
ncbi:hypothetical protein LshimejAT787_1301370 [Lyophyllum shimeji]|uniref:Uncharacterized protein n=1 Tax=Lyophyllum shimeji TaxID=47721 RepID=A0A9P3PX51_LYOSH|nr:hypothetical protein LshimejAT787_1301370 [Lyophyllum shimeji]